MTDEEFEKMLKEELEPFEEITCPITQFLEPIDAFWSVTVSKEELINLTHIYDEFSVYHMLFTSFGKELTKKEYIDLKKRYVKIFVLSIIPLPDCCEELDEKWDVENV